MLALIGDIHGERQWLNHIIKQRRIADDVPIIQLGDYGYWPQLTHFTPDPIRPVYFLDGNHEYFPLLRGIIEITEIKPNSWYIPRGTVVELGGFKIGVLGGADSIDRAWRTEEIDWFADERITDADVTRLYDNVDKAGGIDILLTHTPPIAISEEMIKIHQGHSAKMQREYSYCAQYIQIVWEHLGKPPMWCGHMHPDKPFRALGVNCLPINWLDLVEPDNIEYFGASNELTSNKEVLSYERDVANSTMDDNF